MAAQNVFLQMVIQPHENNHGQIRQNGDLSEQYPITIGVKAGRVLTLTLFSMVLKQVTVDMDVEDGVHVRYRMDGSLFSIRRLQDHTKTFSEQALLQITSCYADA